MERLTAIALTGLTIFFALRRRALPYANAIAPMGRNTIKFIVTKNNYDC
jgi:hypothetical protein